MHVNQKGDEIQEEAISYHFLSMEEKNAAVSKLFEHLGIELVRTNRTKYGNFEIQLQKTVT